MDLTPFIRPHVNLQKIANIFDELSHTGRLSAMNRFGKHEQAALFEAAAGFHPVSLDTFVPHGLAPKTEVIHHGINSLQAFTHFQKRWCRIDARNELVGYNHQPMQWLTGPGYFVARPANTAGEVLIDYTATPAEKPDAWPPIRSNRWGFGSLVYGRGMVDVMRGISNHLTVGRAMRNGQFIDNWFLLCREEPFTTA